MRVRDRSLLIQLSRVVFEPVKFVKVVNDVWMINLSLVPAEHKVALGYVGGTVATVD